jgi:hypothetical protein
MAACLVQRQRLAHPEATGWQRAGDPGAPMTSGDERDELSDKRATKTEKFMREAPPPSVLGDVEDAVAPEVDGELTRWSPPKQGEEESDD